MEESKTTLLAGNFELTDEMLKIILINIWIELVVMIMMKIYMENCFLTNRHFQRKRFARS